MSTRLTPQTAGSTTVYVVAGGNHVEIVLDRSQSNELLDVIEVRAAPGGGPPPHRHAFAEWFRVLEGELTFTEERDGVMCATHALGPGGSVFIAPWTYHGTLNLSEGPCRFEVVGQPGMMSGYFAQAGVPVADVYTEPNRAPPGPAELRDISACWGIEFWTGPTDSTSPPAMHPPA
jgi:quercetin dioxygenase-like cupin family protein